MEFGTVARPTKAKTVAEWKAFYIKRIMDRLSKSYASNSSTYLRATNGLSKLSLDELSAMWVLVLTS